MVQQVWTSLTQASKFAGPIPEEIGNLHSALKVFSLSENEFNGSIPKEIGNLTRLTILNLGYNNLTGMNVFKCDTFAKFSDPYSHLQSFINWQVQSPRRSVTCKCWRYFI